MSHSPSRQREVHDAWLRWFELVRLDGPLVLLDAPLIDPASLGVFQDLAACGALELFIEDEVPRPDDLHGGRSFDLGHTALTLAFARLGRAESLALSVIELPWPEHDADLDAERSLWLELVAGHEVGARAWFDMLAHCFDFQGFAAVIRLGEHIERFGQQLDRATRAEAHTLIGLSAYARHVESQGSEAIGEFMAEHFGRALELEDDRVRRAALMQRMSMVEARRRGDPGAARRWAESAITEVEQASGDAASYVAAWSRNALAYVLARARAFDEARREMDRAFEIVIAIELESPAIPSGERALSELALLDNRIELALLAGDRESALDLSAELAERERALTGRTHLAHVRRIRLLARIPERTRECAELAREAAAGFRRSGSPLDELECTAQLAELSERLVELDRAIAAHERCLVLRSELASEQARAATRVRLALARWRSGRVREAHDELGELVERDEDPVVVAMLARITADLEARDAAEAIANRAIDGATELGDGRTVLRVALWLIELAQAIGDSEAAEDLSAEGHRIAREFPDSISPSERAWLAAITGDPTLVRDPRFDLVDALTETSPWWRLGDLASVLERAGRSEDAARVEALVRSQCSASQVSSTSMSSGSAESSER